MTPWYRDLDRGVKPFYLVICDGIRRAIASGQLRAGERLPSHRKLATILDVAIGTVTRAYREAFERGLVTREVGRGSFVRHHPEPAGLRSLYRGAPDSLLDLYQNLPVPVPTLEDDAWRSSLEGIRRGAAVSDLASAVWSRRRARDLEAGVHWIRRLGVDRDPETLIPCPGPQAARTAILASNTKPGDRLLCARLVHPGLRAVARELSLEVVPVDSDEHGFLPSALERAVRREPVAETSVLYIEPSLQNPTAVTTPLNRRREIAAVAMKASLLILEKEEHGFLFPRPIPPIASLAQDRTFLLVNTWLALSPGLRTSWIACPNNKTEEVTERLLDNAASLTGLAPPLLSEIAASWILSDWADTLISERRKRLASRQRIAEGVLADFIDSPTQGHHLWLRLPSSWRGEGFVAAAREQGVAVTAGSWFASDATVPIDAVRICLGAPTDEDALTVGLRTIRRLLENPGE